MPRISIAACATVVCIALPAAAQNTMSGPSATTSASTSTMTCDQMMAKAQSMSTSAMGARMTMAQNEKSMAKQAKAKGDEAGCKMHMEKAMKLMK